MSMLEKLIYEDGFSLEEIYEMSRTTSDYNCDGCKFKKYCNVCVFNNGYLVAVRDNVDSVKDLTEEEFLRWNITRLKKEEGYSKTKIHKIVKKLVKLANS